MSNSYPPSAKLKAAGLWQKTSARGNTYFVGRLGGLRIAILENHARSGENEPSHFLYFADGEAPRPETRDPAPARARAPGQRSAYPAARRSSPGDARTSSASVHALPDDPVDDLWPTAR
jgi:hypothetical protein